ncbi:hypothetical protein [Arthrobacter sp. B1I2]|uniref:hypothetical protein n=1 Tax=Arthrobacter sp. B1I2 TaxID=3042263 RepID=UPI002780A69E|nr:hypothetical protein [Arthrobacter sp. B1I2]MDQ0730575.1 lysylphosphatidylglycerol synthetase-like protein (DUF2156 family) [Arthrobacter sp. B1I2]
METTPPQEPRPAPPGGTSAPSDFGGHSDQPPHGVPGNEGPSNRGPGNKGATSLVLAILAPASMFLTGPLSMFAMLMTYPDEGPSPWPWVTPLVLFSLPLLFASLALRLSLPAMNRSLRGSGNWSAAAVSLCICGLVFALALGPALDLIGVF